MKMTHFLYTINFTFDYVIILVKPRLQSIGSAGLNMPATISIIFIATTYIRARRINHVLYHVCLTQSSGSGITMLFD